ncbi:hypothetical protein ACP8XO_004082, partial [Escherichia coli]
PHPRSLPDKFHTESLYPGFPDGEKASLQTLFHAGKASTVTTCSFQNKPSNLTRILTTSKIMLSIEDE